MECKLKQAQVILNLEGETNINGNVNAAGYNNNTTIYELSHNSSQKTLLKHF